MTDQTSSPGEQTAYLPLYLQVKSLILKRIGAGSWKPGEMLPSEYELAAEYRVSQGTVRKALMALEDNKMLVRRQGVGTFVARHSRDQALFQFFRMVADDGQLFIPTSKVISHRLVKAKRQESTKFGIALGASLHAIVRIRLLDGVPTVFERILTPVELMENLSIPKGTKMENEMYVIYQERFGISVARVEERLGAVAASAEEALHLGVETGTPLLEISRIALDVNDRVVELRDSRCMTEKAKYASNFK